ncbi:MAG TPA: hypothetical protein VMT67_06200 [Terriglobales bacterium]|nr:hypothetical protein [Terriglobales bacterium]
MALRPTMLAAIVCMFSLAPVLRAANKASCTFDTFDAPSGYTLNTVQGIADDGTVVGQLIENKSQSLVGFMMSPGGDFTVYKAPKSSMTWLYQQNATGTSSGSYADSKYKLHGFTLIGGNFVSFDYPGAANTWLYGVNHVGALTGSYGSGGSISGFLLVNGSYTKINYPKGTTTYPMAINDNNAIVGSSINGLVSSGFLWQNNKFTTISYPNSKYGTALTGINNAGVIVGNRLSADKAFAFLYENNTFESIVYEGAKFEVVGGINNNGVISGQIYFTQTDTLGFTAVCK